MSAKCQHCGKESRVISRVLGSCLDCIRQEFFSVLPNIEEAHTKAGSLFDLPVHPPASATGPRCHICANECRLPSGGRSYCGLRHNRGNTLKGAAASKGNVSWYHDPLPTNCVADWVCAGGTGAGYPQFAHRAGPEYGHKNLAVFYQACSFDCLFCHNWQYRSQALAEDCLAEVKSQGLTRVRLGNAHLLGDDY